MAATGKSSASSQRLSPVNGRTSRNWPRRSRRAGLRARTARLTSGRRLASDYRRAAGCRHNVAAGDRSRAKRSRHPNPAWQGRVAGWHHVPTQRRWGVFIWVRVLPIRYLPTGTRPEVSFNPDKIVIFVSLLSGNLAILLTARDKSLVENRKKHFLGVTDLNLDLGDWGFSALVIPNVRRQTCFRPN
jgi:hypothetical protein